MKVCKKCGERKKMSSYYRDRAKADGYMNACIDCQADAYMGKKARQVGLLLRKWRPA